MDLKELQQQIIDALKKEQAMIEAEIAPNFPEYKTQVKINSDFSLMRVTLINDKDFYQELSFNREVIEDKVAKTFSCTGFKINPNGMIGIVLQPLIIPFEAAQFVFDLLDKIYLIKTLKDETKAVESKEK